MTTRLPSTLKRVKVPAEHVGFAERRIAEQVRYAVASFSGYRTLHAEMADLALSCYLQGVQDGVQVAAARPEVIALFAEAA